MLNYPFLYMKKYFKKMINQYKKTALLFVYQYVMLLL